MSNFKLSPLKQEKIKKRNFSWFLMSIIVFLIIISEICIFRLHKEIISLEKRVFYIEATNMSIGGKNV